jgi:hypothetical protein
MFENKMIGKVFGLKKDEIIEQLRILHYKDLHDLHLHVELLG